MKQLRLLYIDRAGQILLVLPLVSLHSALAKQQTTKNSPILLPKKDNCA